MRQPRSVMISLGDLQRQPGEAVALTSIALLLSLAFASAASPQGADEYSAAVSPTSVPAAGSDTFTVTLTNAGSSGVMGSANVTVNGGFTSITAATTTAGWTAIPVGSVIELRSTAGNEVGPGFAVSVDIDATAPTTTGTYTWDSDARPTNDFTGTAELTLIGADPAVTVTPGPLDHFTIANIVDQVSGTAFNVAATTRDQYNNVKTDYAGGATLSGNLGTTPDSTAPSYGSFGTWASGVASASVTAFNAESGGRGVTATDGSATGTSDGFKVAPGPIDHFTFATIPDPVSGAAFNVTATAFDQWDNVKTDYASGATLSGNLSNAPNDNTVARSPAASARGRVAWPMRLSPPTKPRAVAP